MPKTDSELTRLAAMGVHWERDPRVDPKVGDILRMNGCDAIITYINSHGVVICKRHPKGKHPIQWNITAFRWAFQNAEVLHAAD